MMASTGTHNLPSAIGKGARTAADRELTARLRRHVGHSLRCVRELGEVASRTIETVSLRCEDCGEVVLEAIHQIRKVTRPRA